MAANHLSMHSKRSPWINLERRWKPRLT
jgi:hypothetical protein